MLTLAGFLGGLVAGSRADPVTADHGRMSSLVPMMSRAEVGALDVSTATDLATTTISPVRILDTRPGAAALGGSDEPWSALETRTVVAAGLGSIPEDAVGVVVNVTALNATDGGTFLTLFPTGGAMPNASTLNPSPNEVAFNAATVLLGPEGTFEVYNYSGTVDVIVDVTAYMTRTLADDVTRLQSGDLYIGRHSAGIGISNGLSLHDTWGGILGGSDEMDSIVYSSDLSEERYSADARVDLKVVLDGFGLGDGIICLRLATVEGGPMLETELCTDSVEPEIVGSTSYYVMTSSQVPLNGRQVFLQAKAFAGDGTPIVNASLQRWQFRVFDN
ncbi:MAG: hypothetical protein O2801_08390 [Actinomycetota bacterium]|nr:hypothetical protein [Actinomycetota bacterium]